MIRTIIANIIIVALNQKIVALYLINILVPKTTTSGISRRLRFSSTIVISSSDPSSSPLNVVVTVSGGLKGIRYL